MRDGPWPLLLLPSIVSSFRLGAGLLLRTASRVKEGLIGPGKSGSIADEVDLPVPDDDVVGDPRWRHAMNGPDMRDECFAIVEGRALDVAAVRRSVDRHRSRHRVVIATPEPLHARVARRDRDRDDDVHVRPAAPVAGARDAACQHDEEHRERAHESTLSRGYPSHKPRVDGSEAVE